VLDEVGTGTCGDLFHLEHTVKGKEDAANDGYPGHYMVRTEFINLTLNGIGNLRDQCTGCKVS
jgi:hypothetical protein